MMTGQRLGIALGLVSAWLLSGACQSQSESEPMVEIDPVLAVYCDPGPKTRSWG